MLRRAPTALTLSPADLADFEQLHAMHVAHAEYLRTGQDPQHLFAGYTDEQIRSKGFIRRLAGVEAQQRLVEEQQHQHQQYQQHQHQQHQQTVGTAAGSNGGVGGGGVRDPSDELKPLPGDKARIVRAREERIMGR